MNKNKPSLKRYEFWKLIVAPIIVFVVSGLVLSFIHTNTKEMKNDNEERTNQSNESGNNIVINNNSGSVTVIIPEPDKTPISKNVECSLSRSDAVKFAEQPFSGIAFLNKDISITETLYNHTKGDNEYFPMAIAKNGDEIIYRVKIINHSGVPFEPGIIKVELPSSLEYQNDYSRVLYKFDGIEKEIAINDSVVKSGSSLPLRILPNDFVYLIFKVKVAEDSVCGIYGAATQIYNEKTNFNLSANDGLIFVKN